MGSFFDDLQLEAGPSVIDVTVESSGTAPAPTVLDESHSDWESYEGMLVTVTGSLTVGEPDAHGIAAIDGTGLELDDTLYAYSSGSYTSITGIVFDGLGDYQLLPRDATDLAAE